MKKILALMLAAALALSLAACGGGETPSNGSSASADTLEKIEFTQKEAAGIAALQKLLPEFDKTLKDPSSLEILSVEVALEEDGKDIYCVKVEYNAANSFGGKVRDAAYEKVQGTKVIDGLGAATPFNMALGKYVHPERITELDLEKVMNHIDTDLSGDNIVIK